jgi:hypothetical protein
MLRRLGKCIPTQRTMHTICNSTDMGKEKGDGEDGEGGEVGRGGRGRGGRGRRAGSKGERWGERSRLAMLWALPLK